MDFSQALYAIKAGKCVTRDDWSAFTKIFLVQGSTVAVNRPPLSVLYPEGVINYRPHIDVVMVDGSIEPFTFTQSDLLADDWSLVE
jgi:hypothetical protein